MPILRAGMHFGASQLLTFVASNADTVAIGAQLGAGPLGLYNRAFQLMTIPVSRTLGPLTRVAIPAINRASKDGHNSVGLLLRVQSCLGIFLVGALAAAAAVAPILIPLVLGPDWDSSVPLFQILALAGAIQVWTFVCYWGFLLVGSSQAFFRSTLVTKPLAAGLVVVASFFGVEAVAVAYALGLAVSWPIGLIWLQASAGLRSWPFFADGLRTLTAAIASFVSGTLVLSATETLDPLGSLVLSCFGALAMYVVAFVLIPGGRKALRNALRVLLRVMTRR